jgi:cyclopropane fatty-acyl-phospholipid synthase-like methyltransferase
MLESVYAEPQRLRGFVQGMHNLTVADAQEIVDAFDFSPFNTLLEVGGTSGALVIAALKKHPKLKGIVFEQPAVCAIADDYLKQYGVDDRAKTHPGDFFQRGSLPLEADVITLGWILHDWPEEQCKTILQHCFEVLQPGGTIVVCEKLLNESGTGPLLTTLMDLHALVSTGGQERSAAVYQQWLEEAGFTGTDVRLLEGNRDLVIARKP